MPFGQVEGLFDTAVLLPRLLDELGLGVMVLTPDRKIMLLNSTAEGLTGFTREEVGGLPCRSVLRPNICHSECPVLQASKSNGPVTMEGNIINRARQKIPVRLTAAPLRDVNGNVVGFLETIEDIRPFQRLDDHTPEVGDFGQFIGRSPRMKELFKIIPVIAQTDSSVLITGETGTGKDVLAEVIHNVSDRREGTFIKINCGALPETLLESELFGHKKGAFTGAVSDKMGRLRLAHNGTLYLTEIGDLPLSLQVKLLTFLDDQVVHPLGSTEGIQVEVRMIAATHRNLEQMVKEGLFREDLLFRLNVVRMQIPPLRERDGDISLLLEHFLKVYCARFEKNVKGFSKQAQEFLNRYPFPGNVRELRNIVEYATNMSQSEYIGMEHLPSYLTQTPVFSHQDGSAAQPLSVQRNAVSGNNAEMKWADIERQVIVDTLIKANGRRSKAAEILGWGRTTLWRKMKQYGLES